MTKEEIMKAFEAYAEAKYVEAVKKKLASGYRWVYDTEYEGVVYLVNLDGDPVIALTFENGEIVDSEFKDNFNE
jgi:hypothetical protein